MELTCPACRARYGVPDSELSRAGRVVRCSACGAEWVARGAAPAGRGESAAPDADLDWRPVSMRPDLRPPGGRSAEAEERERRAAGEPAAHALRREAETPRPPEEAMVGSLEDREAAEPARARRGGAAFMAGFALVALLALAAAVVYVKREDIAVAVPAAAEPLEAYGAAVDRGRVALARLAETARGAF